MSLALLTQAGEEKQALLSNMLSIKVSQTLGKSLRELSTNTLSTSLCIRKETQRENKEADHEDLLGIVSTYLHFLPKESAAQSLLLTLLQYRWRLQTFTQKETISALPTSIALESLLR
jgi:hypothetical protein